MNNQQVRKWLIVGLCLLPIIIFFSLKFGAVTIGWEDFFKIIFKSSICYIVTQIIHLHNIDFLEF